MVRVRPKVSIIVPIYNVEAYLIQALESVINQTLKEIEIICVNDGSTDDSLSIAQNFSKTDSRIKIIDQVNQGYGVAMNRGMDEAVGEYLGIVEPDDWVEPNMYAELYQVAKTHKLDLAKSKFEEFGVNISNIVDVLKPDAKYQKVLNLTEDFIKVGNTPGIWTGIYNLDWLRKKAIRFNTTPRAAYQDTSFFLLTTVRAKRALFLPEVLYHYRYDNPESSRNIKGQTFVINREFYYLERMLKQNYSEWEKYRGYFIYKKVYSYLWNLDRISIDDKLPFLRRMAQEFGWSRQCGDVDESILLDWQIDTIRKIINDPEAYFYEKYAEGHFREMERELREVRFRLNEVESSTAWKVGRLVTFIPRWLKRNLSSRR
jgi:glycosyltransferase involved in cell wall biosynthesis